jgi:hypothetical protein
MAKHKAASKASSKVKNIRSSTDLDNKSLPKLRGNGRWTVPVNPRKTLIVTQTLRPSHVIVRNRGPATVKLVAQDSDLIDLSPGDLRVTYAAGTVKLDAWGDQYALVDLEIQPIFLKY